MIKNLCVRITEIWCDSNVITESDKEEYMYGLELLISTTINLFCLILISFLFGKQQLLIPYLLSFIPVRLFAGGFHAKTHWGCVTFTSVLYSLTLLFVHIIPTRASFQVGYIIALFSLVVIHSLAPVAAVNKPLTTEEHKVFRKVSQTISLCILMLALVADLCKLNIHNDIVLTYLCGEGAAAVSMVVQEVVAKSRENR